MENTDAVLDKVNIVLDKLAELGEKNEVVTVEVGSAKEAEMILLSFSLISNEYPYRNRVFAIVFLEPSGLHLKGVGGTWEVLKQLTGPAVLLVPSGIVNTVRQESRISWGKEPEKLEKKKGCSGCLLAILIIIGIYVLIVIIKYFINRS